MFELNNINRVDIGGDAKPCTATIEVEPAIVTRSSKVEQGVHDRYIDILSKNNSYFLTRIQ